MLLAVPAADVAALFMGREQVLGRGLALLAGWVLLNLVGSGYYLAHADRRHAAYYFHGLNVLWNLVNAALATWGILRLHFVPPAGLDALELLRSQQSYETLFGVNAGLDVLYVLAGSFLRRRAARPGQAQPQRLAGFGWSLWVQGGFLFLFDATMWGVLHYIAEGWPRMIS